jgi:hypothetical protein
MVPDMQTQVWLETVPGTVPALVVAYVKTDRGAQMTYRMDVVHNGKSGMSRISQSGTVRAAAGEKTQLGKVSVSSQPGDDCNVAVSVREGAEELGSFRFDCPR